MDKMTKAQLIDKGYNLHHVASCMGYTRVGDIGRVDTYSGKFGKGYKRYVGRHNNSTKYQDIEYWII